MGEEEKEDRLGQAADRVVDRTAKKKTSMMQQKQAEQQQKLPKHLVASANNYAKYASIVFNTCPKTILFPKHLEASSDSYARHASIVFNTSQDNFIHHMTEIWINLLKGREQTTKQGEV